MRAGILKNIVEIQRKQTNKNEFGETVESWQTLKSIRAGVKFISGTETDQNKEVFYQERILITIRTKSGITHQDRIKYNSVKYAIKAINYDSLNQTEQITAEKINE